MIREGRRAAGLARFLSPVRLGAAQAPLGTERLGLATLAVADGPAMAEVVLAPHVACGWDEPPLIDADVVSEHVLGQINEMVDGVGASWAVRRAADETVLGWCELTAIDRAHRRAEVGFVLTREAAIGGEALEALQAVIRHAAEIGLRRLSARTQLGQRQADQVLEAAGFTQEGLLRGHVVRKDERRDCRIFGRLL